MSFKAATLLPRSCDSSKAPPRATSTSTTPSPAATTAASSAPDAGALMPIVIIPSYNPRPGDLEAAVSSAFACESVVRIIVVDDGSPTPISLAPVPRLQIIRRKNAGPSAARNTGLDACPDADSVILLDHDDRLIPAGVAA